MGIAYVSNARKIAALVAGALLLSSLALGGCATSTSAPSLMDARAEAPASPKTGAYPALGNPPADREQRGMTPAERLKLEQELIAARDRQMAAAKAQGGPIEPIKP